MTLWQKRQGDFLFTKVDSIPNRYSFVSKDNIVGLGEVSGHKHMLLSGEFRIPKADIFARDNVIPPEEAVGYIKTDNHTSITHDEHDPLDLEPGIYEVKRQKEFSGERTRRQKAVRVAD